MTRLWIGIVCLTGFAGQVQAQSSTQVLVGSGAIEAQRGGLTLVGTVGQPVVGPSAEEAMQVALGFWAEPPPPAPDSTGVSNEAAELPSVFALHRNYPNPFNPSTVITYALPSAAEVRLEVFDLFGRRVRVLVEERLGPGLHTAVFDAAALASGVYLYRLTAGAHRETRRMMLVK